MRAAAIISSTPWARRAGAASARSPPISSPAFSCLHHRLFEDVPGRIFSLVRLFDRAEAAGRLRAIVHDGEWYHVGTPEGLAATRERLSSHRIEH